MSEEVVDTGTPVVSTETVTPTPTTPDVTEQQTAASIRDMFLKNVPEGASTKWIDKYTDDKSLVNGIYALQHMAGRKTTIPDDKSSEDQIRGFWDQLGANDLKVEHKPLGAEFSAISGELDGYYGDVAKSLQEVAKEVIPTAKNIPDLLNKVYEKFVQNDATKVIQMRKEAEAQSAEDFRKFATSIGMTPEQFSKERQEFLAAKGINETDDINKLIYQYMKETSNSRVIKDAFMSNTNEGLDEQINDLSKKLSDRSVPQVEHDKNLAKMKELLKNKANLMQRT